MRITMQNFGKFEAKTMDVADYTAPNASGKTTLLNAYTWVLSGRTIGGFEPRRIDAIESETTSVILHGFVPDIEIRRVLVPKGTALYVDGNVITQTAFVECLAGAGVDLDLTLLCADANKLTSDTLTSEELRKLFIRAGVMDGEETEKLRKDAERIRKAKRQAEQYALANVVIPTHSVCGLSESEEYFLTEYRLNERIAASPVTTKCTTCGHELSKLVIANKRAEQFKAKTFVEKHKEEADRLYKRSELYDKEQNEIDDAKRIISAATRAREDVVRYETELRVIDERLRELDLASVRAELPTGVEIVTEATSKTGNAKGVCTITYFGVPLRSINRAGRIEICVRILDRARTQQGMAHIPIWIDNAEAIQGVTDIENIIRLTVG